MTAEGPDARVLDLSRLGELADAHDRPLLFATVSGAHLYGFASQDSDIDLRGAHILGVTDLAGLRRGADTITRDWEDRRLEIDLVTHDVAKFARMMLRPNGYVLEQVLSPLVVRDGALAEELRGIARRCPTSGHLGHYQGFARGQWSLHLQTGRLKPALYALRVLLSGIHLMRTGEVQAHLPSLHAGVSASPPYVPDLIAAKASREKGLLADGGSDLPDQEDLARDIERLQSELVDAHSQTSLPSEPSPDLEPALHDLVLRSRRG